MQLYVYNQNCVQAGRQVPDRELERYDDPRDGNDWHLVDGTPEELLAEAEELENPQPRNGENRFPNSYAMHKARAIREAVYFERPDLEPAEAE